MSVRRFRASADDQTLAVDIDMAAACARLRSEAELAETDRQGANETAFRLVSIDLDVVGVIPDDACEPEQTSPPAQAQQTERTRQADRARPAEPAGTPLRAHVVAEGETTWVFIDGETFTIDVEPAERVRSRRAAHGSEGLAAPMPATVIKVLVEPGADVHRGDLLLLLEAMKMELPVRAPRDGRVKALHCRPGELVQPGTALVELE